MNVIIVFMFDNFVNRIGFMEFMEGMSNFSCENIILINVMGMVYKVMFLDNMVVVIKWLCVSLYNDKVFMMEMEVFGNFKYCNFVLLFGYCVVVGECLFVY